MTTDPHAAANRFHALWRRCVRSPPSPDANAVYAELCGLLGAQSRYFHNLGHVSECLRHFDEVATWLDEPDAVELALWFHDAVYEPGNPANERRSAELFIRCSQGAQPLLRRRVCGLILATRHGVVARGHDRRYIEDIDLAGFGASWEEFMHNGDLLRIEFAGQFDAGYSAGQVAFLERLRRRPTFFATDAFRARYEANAQDNLRRLLALRTGESLPPTPG
ncbi:MAG: hypothetical protein IT521_06585 [Burkholderiales bacterium]|nr:hypothetical protein [Burkholderiales bacterium]